MNAFKIWGEIALKSDDSVKELKALDKKADESATKLKKGFQKAGDAMTKALVAGAVLAGAAIVKMGVDGIKSMIAFEESLNKVLTLLPDVSDEFKAELADMAQFVSEEFGRPVEETFDAMYNAISAGVPTEALDGFMDVVGRLTVGGSLESMSDGVLVLAASMNAYGASAEEAEEFSDVLMQTVADGITTMPELAANMSKVTSAAANAGISFKDLNAWIAQLTSLGEPTAEALTKIKAATGELSKAGTAAANAFKEATGQSFQDFLAAGNDIGDAFEELSEFADASGVSVSDLFGSLEAGAAVLMASGDQADSFAGKLDNMAEVAGNTNDAYETMASGIKNKLDRLGQWWEGLKRRMGFKLEEPLEKLMAWLEANKGKIEDAVGRIFDGIVNAFTWIGDNWQKVETGLKAVGVAIVAMVAINVATKIGNLVIAMKGLAAVVGSGSTLMTGLGALGVVLGVVTAAIIALRGPVSGFIEDSKDATIAAGDLEESIGGLADTAEDTEKASEVLHDAINRIGTAVINLNAGADAFSMKPMLDELEELRQTVLELDPALRVDSWNNGVKEILSAYSHLGPGMEEIANDVSAAFDSIPGAARATGEAVGDEMIEGAEDSLEINSPSRAMERVGLQAMEGLEDGVEEGGDGVIAQVEQVADRIEGAFDGITVGSIAHADALEDIEREYRSVIDAMDTLEKHGQPVSDSLLQQKKSLEELFPTLEETTDRVMEMDEAWQAAADSFESAVEGTFRDGFRDLLDMHEQNTAAVERHGDRVDEINEEIAGSREALIEEYDKQLKALEDSRDDDIIGEEEYTAEKDRLYDEQQTALDDLIVEEGRLMDEAATQLDEDRVTLGSILEDMKDSFVSKLKDIVAEFAAAKVASFLFGDSIGSIGSQASSTTNLLGGLIGKLKSWVSNASSASALGGSGGLLSGVASTVAKVAPVAAVATTAAVVVGKTIRSFKDAGEARDLVEEGKLTGEEAAAAQAAAGFSGTALGAISQGIGKLFGSTRPIRSKFDTFEEYAEAYTTWRNRNKFADGFVATRRINLGDATIGEAGVEALIPLEDSTLQRIGVGIAKAMESSNISNTVNMAGLFAGANLYFRDREEADAFAKEIHRLSQEAQRGQLGMVSAT